MDVAHEQVTDFFAHQCHHAQISGFSNKKWSQITMLGRCDQQSRVLTSRRTHTRHMQLSLNMRKREHCSRPSIGRQSRLSTMVSTTLMMAMMKLRIRVVRDDKSARHVCLKPTRPTECQSGLSGGGMKPIPRCLLHSAERLPFRPVSRVAFPLHQNSSCRKELCE